MLRLRRYGRISIENRRFHSNRVSMTQNFRYKRSPKMVLLGLERWVTIFGGNMPPKPTTNHSSCQKTRINVLSCGVRMWTQVSFILPQCSWLTDGQTDGKKGLGNTMHCITCNHMIHPYLPERQDSSNNLRKHSHIRTLITKGNYLYECNFIIQMLYKNCYWCIGQFIMWLLVLFLAIF